MFSPFSLALLPICINAFAQSYKDELVSVVALYRHGDRAPISPYKYDPYADESYWPLGFGELTNIGKNQQYSMGTWLRKRYTHFLPVFYNKKNIKIRSSNVDRCLMSAQSNVAGLYPPEGYQVWNEKLRWQPMPIHTLPEKEDPILAQGKSCSRYNQLYGQLMKEEPFSTIFERYKDQIDYFSKNSGQNFTSLLDLIMLYNTVYIESIHNLTQPEWTEALLTEEMEQLCGLVWSSFAYNQDMARLKSGPLIDLILTHFENVKNNVEDTPKFLMLSGHDMTIATLLTSLQVFDNKWPDFASLVLFELRKSKNTHYVNIFYRNPTEVVKITLPGCNFNCGLGALQRAVAPIRVGLVDWETECQAV